MGFISRLLMIPRPVRRAMHPARTVKNAVTPRPVKRVKAVSHPVDNAVYKATRRR